MSVLGRFRQRKIDTVIGPNTVVHGSLRFAHGAHISGTILGPVEPKQPKRRSTVVVDHSAVIHGAVSASHIELRGQVYGDVGAQKDLVLGADAKVFGNLTYQQITIETAASPSGADAATTVELAGDTEDPRFQGILQALREAGRNTR